LRCLSVRKCLTPISEANDQKSAANKSLDVRGLTVAAAIGCEGEAKQLTMDNIHWVAGHLQVLEISDGEWLHMFLHDHWIPKRLMRFVAILNSLLNMQA
jgi:hypothetical protein